MKTSKENKKFLDMLADKIKLRIVPYSKRNSDYIRGFNDGLTVVLSEMEELYENWQM